MNSVNFEAPWLAAVTCTPLGIPQSAAGGEQLAFNLANIKAHCQALLCFVWNLGVLVKPDRISHTRVGILAWGLVVSTLQAPVLWMLCCGAHPPCGHKVWGSAFPPAQGTPHKLVEYGLQLEVSFVAAVVVGLLFLLWLLLQKPECSVWASSGCAEACLRPETMR